MTPHLQRRLSPVKLHLRLGAQPLGVSRGPSRRTGTLRNTYAVGFAQRYAVGFAPAFADTICMFAWALDCRRGLLRRSLQGAESQAIGSAQLSVSVARIV